MPIIDRIKQRQATGSELLLSKLKKTLVTNANPLKSFSRSVYSMESMTAEDQATVDGAVDDLERSLTSVLGDEQVQEKLGNEFTEDQVNAALLAGTVAGNEVIRTDVIEKTSREPSLAPGDVLVPTNFLNSGEANVGRMSEALESYDTTENRNSMEISMSYNLKAAKQDAFGEAHFPTVTIAPDVATVTISVDLLT